MPSIEKIKLPVYIVMLNFTLANRLKFLNNWNTTSVEEILSSWLPESEFIKQASLYCKSRRCVASNGDRCKLLGWYSDEVKANQSQGCVVMGFYDHIFKRSKK